MALLVASALVFSGSAAGIVYADIRNSLTVAPVEKLLVNPRPIRKPIPVDSQHGHPVNILIMGSDVREGDSDVDGAGRKGKVEGMRSDTTLLMHISADRSRIEVVSIPRDTLVDIPRCKRADGGSTGAQYETMFNTAFSNGGIRGDVASAAACTIATAEKLTGVYIDDFVVLDFAGFRRVVDALGGVAFYMPKAAKDRNSGLDVKKGCQLLSGVQALALARARKGLGDGSDLSRIDRQQQLFGAIFREVLSKNLLSDLPSLYQFVKGITSSLTMGETLGNLTSLGGLAYSIRNVSPEDIRFVTMPVYSVGPRVKPSAGATKLWKQLREDEPVTGAVDGDGKAPADAPAKAGKDTGAKDTSKQKPSAKNEPAPAKTPKSATKPGAPSPGKSTDEPPICTKESLK